MVFKQCWYDKATGCSKRKCHAPDVHPWYVKGAVVVAGIGKVPYRGSVKKFLHLLPAGAVEPRNREAVEVLEGIIVGKLAHNEPIDVAPAPPPRPSPDGSTTTTPRGAGSSLVPATIAAAVTKYHDGHGKNLADKAAPSILKRIATTLGDRPLIDLYDRTVVREFLESVERASSSVNRNRHLSRLQHMAGWLKDEYMKYSPELAAAASPFFDRRDNRRGIKKDPEGDGRDRRTTLDEEHALIKAAKQLADGGMMLGRVYAALDCGLRQGEMLAIRRGAVVRNYRNSGGVWLKVEWATAKQKKTRHVPVTTPRLLQFLDGRRFSDYVFGQLDGSAISESGFEDDWDRVRVASGLWTRARVKPGKCAFWELTWVGDGLDLHWHDFRHEYASRLAAKGVPVTTIRRLLGHASLVTTQRYENTEAQTMLDHVRAAQG